MPEGTEKSLAYCTEQNCTHLENMSSGNLNTMAKSCGCEHSCRPIAVRVECSAALSIKILAKVTNSWVGAHAIATLCQGVLG